MENIARPDEVAARLTHTSSQTKLERQIARARPLPLPTHRLKTCSDTVAQAKTRRRFHNTDHQRARDHARQPAASSECSNDGAKKQCDSRPLSTQQKQRFVAPRKFVFDEAE